jgi:aquaporin Z
MNRARTFGPDLASGKFTLCRINDAGPLTGAPIAVGVAFVLGGAGGGSAGSGAARADLFIPGAAISAPARRAFRRVTPVGGNE